MTTERENLWSAFRRSLHTNANRPALAADDRVWTYDQLSHDVAGAADGLREAGVQHGDRVILLLRNGAEFPIHDLAVMALGAIKVPLNALLSPVDVAGIVDRTAPAAVVVSEELEGLLVDAATVPRLTPRLPTGTDSGSLPARAGAGPDDPAVVYFTGGTTGRPKGIVHTQASVLTNLWAHIIEGDIRRDERLLLTTPLAHSAGLFTLAALLRGAFVRIEPGFDADQVLRLLDEERCTWTFAVPTMIGRMVDAATRSGCSPSALRTLQYGAAPISPELLRRAIERFGPVLQQLYGQTECPNFATVLTKDEHVEALSDPERLQSCGKASLMCDVTVMGGDGVEVTPGDVGEIVIKAPYVMDRYWDEAAEDRFFGGWLRTGDIGRIDPCGNVYLVDRRNDMIISGGMNVYSVEVEQVLHTHPSVRQAAVIGVPSSEWGEAVHAIVVGDDSSFDAAAIRSHCRASLAAYKVPKTIELVSELPLTRYGKVDKKALRHPHWAGHERRIH